LAGVLVDEDRDLVNFATVLKVLLKILGNGLKMNISHKYRASVTLVASGVVATTSGR
jgi:hypothetical protein